MNAKLVVGIYLILEPDREAFIAASVLVPRRAANRGKYPGGGEEVN
jgi:hypothetical protein